MINPATISLFFATVVTMFAIAAFVTALHSRFTGWRPLNTFEKVYNIILPIASAFLWCCFYHYSH